MIDAYLRAATQMAVMDAIKKGMKAEDAAEFVKSETFKKAVLAYVKMFEEEFG